MSADVCFFFFSSRRRHTRFSHDWSSDVCSSDLELYTLRRKLGPLARPVGWAHFLLRSEERRVGKSVDLGGRRIIKKKKKQIKKKRIKRKKKNKNKKRRKKKLNKK